MGTAIPLQERGNYYRGLLVLIRKDQVVSREEKEMMIRIGEKLDFDRRFCEATIDDLMKNPHIKRTVIRFGDVKTAESFLRDAVSIALVDGTIHPKERAWLKAVAAANGLKDEWLAALISSCEESGRSETHRSLRRAAAR